MKEQIKVLCKKCGKPQKKNERQSNSNWEVYDAKAKCDCGGEYEMVVGDLTLWRKKMNLQSLDKGEDGDK